MSKKAFNCILTIKEVIFHCFLPLYHPVWMLWYNVIMALKATLITLLLLPYL